MAGKGKNRKCLLRLNTSHLLNWPQRICLHPGLCLIGVLHFLLSFLCYLNALSTRTLLAFGTCFHIKAELSCSCITFQSVSTSGITHLSYLGGKNCDVIV